MGSVEATAVELEQKLKGTPFPRILQQAFADKSRQTVSESKSQEPANDRVPDDDGSVDEEEEDVGATGATGATGWLTET